MGVSTALVSYVMNNKAKEARVSDEMANKIRKAAAKLNYQPNLIAKSLQSGKTNTIGLIVADISNPFFSGIARIIEDEAKKYGYVVIFGSSDESAKKSEDLIGVLLNHQVDAFIIAPAACSEEQLLMLKSRGIPFVLIDRYFPNIDSDRVHINNFQAAYDAIEHLISIGRNKIAMIAYDNDLPHMKERIRGYKEALKKNGIRFKNSWLIKSSYHNIEEDVKEGMQPLIDPSLEVDAFFFATNSLAVEGLKNINALGIEIPYDLGVISFDESDAFKFFYSPITYVSQPVEEMGKQVVKLVIDRIDGHSKKYKTVIADARLVLGESCGRKLKKKK